MYEGFKNSIGATVQNAAGIDQGRPTRAVKADLEGYFLSIHHTSSHREQLIFIPHVQRRWGILVLPCLFAHLSVKAFRCRALTHKPIEIWKGNFTQVLILASGDALLFWVTSVEGPGAISWQRAVGVGVGWGRIFVTSSASSSICCLDGILRRF